MSLFVGWKKYLKIPGWLRISGRGVEDTLLGLGLAKGAKVLDLGCGYGRISMFLKEQGFDVIGIDSDKGMVAKNRGRFDCRLMDGTNTEFDDNSFDLVVTDGILEHFREPEKIINEEIRVSKKFVVNFIPANTWWNRILELMQMTPNVYWRSVAEWEKKHSAFRNVVHKRLLRLDVFTCEKIGFAV